MPQSEEGGSGAIEGLDIELLKLEKIKGYGIRLDDTHCHLFVYSKKSSSGIRRIVSGSECVKNLPVC